MAKSPDTDLPAPQIPEVTDQRKSMHAMALEALVLATQTNMERLLCTEKHLLEAREQRVQKLRALRKRRKLQVLLRRNGSAVPEVRAIVGEHRTQRDEIQAEIDTHLQKIVEFRKLFSQQIEDTTVSDFPDLAAEWAEKFLALDTPFEEEPETTPQQVRKPYTRERKIIASVWRSIRTGLQAAIAGGEKMVPAFMHHMQKFEVEIQQRMSTHEPRARAHLSGSLP
ncbi:MAG TPA: hypothetical protein VJB10_03935 [Candidatus Peribacteraceae bacterium]|nr:hypothetical protein [Candidatus Peribacteraceae bacterium]